LQEDTMKRQITVISNFFTGRKLDSTKDSRQSTIVIMLVNLLLLKSRSFILII